MFIAAQFHAAYVDLCQFLFCVRDSSLVFSQTTAFSDVCSLGVGILFADAPAASKGPNAVVKLYLLAFNLVSCGMWGVMLGHWIKHLLVEKRPVSELHTTIWSSLFIAQSLALLELVHSLLGLVRSPFFSSLVPALTCAPRVTSVRADASQQPHPVDVGNRVDHS